MTHRVGVAKNHDSCVKSCKAKKKEKTGCIARVIHMLCACSLVCTQGLGWFCVGLVFDLGSKTSFHFSVVGWDKCNPKRNVVRRCRLNLLKDVKTVPLLS